MYKPAKWRTSSRRSSIMWKRERATTSPFGDSRSTTTLPTTWFVPRSGRLAAAVFLGGFFAVRFFTSLPRGHVLRPSLHLVAHGRLGGAAVGRGLHDAVLLRVAAVVAVETHPVAAVGREALMRLPEVLQVVGVDQRRGRIDQVVVGERAPVDRLGRAL